MRVISAGTEPSKARAAGLDPQIEGLMLSGERSHLVTPSCAHYEDPEVQRSARVGSNEKSGSWLFSPSVRLRFNDRF